MENNHPVKKFTIDRAKWGRRGLLNSDGSMCCLGFLGKACGVPDISLRRAGVPHYLPKSDLEKIPAWARLPASDGDVCRLVQLNDNSRPTYSSVRRSRPEVEKYIAKTFAKHGITVTFKGKAKKS